MLMLQQTVLTVPNWAGTVTALSLLVIALSVLALAVGATRLAMRLSIRKLVSDGEHIVNLVRDETGAFARTSKRIRRKLHRGVTRIEERLVDLEALYDVVHGEVEETALDVATGLRRFRRGRGIAGRMTRFLLRR